MKVSDLLIHALENEGVEYIFGIPGEENLDFLEALRNSSIKLILTRHEQGAGFMAATYGRLTGKPGVCLSTLGPGATNFMTAAAYAQLGAMPMMMITGQKPIKTSKQGRFQIVDIVQTMAPVTKFARQIVDGHNVPSFVREAFRLAIEERPGAVHLELPEDVASEEIKTEVLPVVANRRPVPDQKAIALAIEKIQEAKRPLIAIGAGANRKRTSKTLLQLIEKTGIPFFNTQMGKGVLDERHELYLGTAALSDGDYLHCAIDQADLIINIGHDVIEKPPFFMRGHEMQVIHINFNHAQIDEVYYPQVDIAGDIATSVWEICEGVEKQEHWDLEYYYNAKKGIDKHIAECADDARFPMIPQRIVRDVRKVMPSDGVIALDNGIYKIWFARNYQAHEPNTVLLDNALATMGAGLPSAMTAKLIEPDKKVVAICGDGGFMMNSQEMETAVRLNLHIVVIILNDNAFGMIKWKQEGMGFENFGLDYNNPDFVKYAESYGAKGHRIESTESFASTLEACLEEPAVHLIDLPIDYSENQRVLIEELKNKSGI
jgi:acetolactate synthase-1/2/3 large subunit